MAVIQICKNDRRDRVAWREGDKGITRRKHLSSHSSEESEGEKWASPTKDSVEPAGNVVGDGLKGSFVVGEVGVYKALYTVRQNSSPSCNAAAPLSVS